MNKCVWKILLTTCGQPTIGGEPTLRGVEPSVPIEPFCSNRCVTQTPSIKLKCGMETAQPRDIGKYRCDQISVIHK